MLKSLKDQVRGVRYSIQAEAEAPGSTLPKALHDLMPVLALSSPALRLANGLFTEVETLATEFLVQPEPSAAFPRPVQDYLDLSTGFSDRLYAAYKEMLTAHGVRAMLVSEQALDQAGDRFRQLQMDLVPRGRPMNTEEVIRASAALVRALVEARPIRKVTFGTAGQASQNLMLSPNLFCGIVVGIATAIVTLKPELAGDGRAVLESAESVAEVRFHRFNRALLSKAPEVTLARELEVVVPFLP